VPELGVVGVPLRVSLWLVPPQARVAAGDRVLELVAGGVTVDIEAPVAGRLVRRFVEEDDEVHGGEAVGEIEATP